MATKLSAVVGVLKVLSDQGVTQANVEGCLKALRGLVNCWVILADVFSFADCKLSGLLDKTSGQVFKIIGNGAFSPEVTSESDRGEVLTLLMKVFNFNVTLLRRQKQAMSVSLHLFIFLIDQNLRFMAKEEPSRLKELAWLPSFIEGVSDFEQTFKNVLPHDQVGLLRVRDSLSFLQKVCEKEGLKKGRKLLGKRSHEGSQLPLQYLSLRQENPKPLPSYPPLIELEFLVRLPRKDKYDEKELKKKTRKYEKDAMRELKKDTQVIMDQKMDLQRQRRQLASRGTKRVGQSLKDEI
uniref:Uncharacterized protein n=1 Tax=Strombidium rassoulzadegani TaxID=1082188 RepID=A0A7S3CHV4_9SPIT|mmetsp:Transcript_11064/g.18509  ORF Transcript_11064/g.18509 Transcript_11064/m.18509 type:complete len:295 (+) Transcript_11064:685-1569(+)